MVGKWFGFERNEVLEEGFDLFERGDFEEATKAFESYLLEDDTDPRVNIYLGKCYQNLAVAALDDEIYAVAAAQAESALLLNPDYPDLHMIAARAYLGLETKALARRHLAKALHLHPGYDGALELLAHLDETDEEIEGNHSLEFSSSTTLKSHSDYLLSIGDDCMRQDLFSEALAVYQKAGQLTPNYPDISYRIASAYLKMGNLESAETELAKCLDLNGTYVEAIMKLSHVRKLRGLVEEGDRLNQQAFAINPQIAGQFGLETGYAS